MELYEIPITPTGGFGTPIKGDTLFGHFCWQAAHNPDLFNDGMKSLADHLAAYPQRPFLVFSSAFHRMWHRDKDCYVLKRPDLPSFMIFTGNSTEDCKASQQRIKRQKDLKWMCVPAGERWPVLVLGRMHEADFLSDESLCRSGSYIQSHNTINRLTNTTGTGMFAPYPMRNTSYASDAGMVIFAIIDPEVTAADRVKEGLCRIGSMGFGRDASSGLGRFGVGEPRLMKLPAAGDANALYTLAPSVPEKAVYSDAWFTPFVRFGKHGDRLSTASNPFKTPVIMADEGAVFRPKDASLAWSRPYMGSAVTHISHAQTNTVMQGFAPFIPMKLEETHV